MLDSIELDTFHIDESNAENNIEEYDEIIQEDNDKYNLSPNFHNKLLEEYAFFTNYDVNSKGKLGENKKKSKKKVKKNDLLDMINSELALIEDPLDRNVITYLDRSRENPNIYLRDNIFSRCKSRHLRIDFETRNEKCVQSISPTFPKILQSTTVENSSIPIQYIQPIKYKDYISNYIEFIEKDVKFLDIEIQNLKIKYHHAISLEELLCEKLLEVYKEYKKVLNNITNICHDITVNRNTKDNFKKSFLKITKNTDDLKFDPTQRKYTGKFLLLKEHYYKARKLEKEKLHNIITLWSDIETVRQKYNFVKTPYQLKISQTVIDDETFEEEWCKIFDEEFSDKLDKIEYDYVTKYMEYKKQKHEQNIDKMEKKKLSKPKLKLDKHEIRDEVSKTVRNLVIKEKIEIILNYNKDIVTKSKIKQPCSDSNDDNIIIKLFIDDMFICETDASNNKSNKESNFLDYISVQVLSNNKKLSMILYENDFKQDTYHFNINDIKRSIDNTEINTISFTYNIKIEPDNKNIGCGFTIKEIAKTNGVRLKSNNLFKENVTTQIDTQLKIGWKTKSNQVNREATKTYIETSSKIKQLRNCNGNKIFRDVIEKVYDKNKEEVEDILYILNNRNKFPINSLKEGTFYINENTFDVARFKLLHLRNMGEFAEIDSKLVPIHSNQMSTQQLNLLQKLKDNELIVDYFDKDRYGEMDPIEMQRYIGYKYIQSLNKNMLKNLNEHLMRKSYKDVVCDFKDLSLRNIIKNETSLTTLANVPNCVTQYRNGFNGKDVDIFINVLRAFNLPDRKASVIAEENEDAEDIAGFKVRSLRPFVRVSYRDISLHTSTAIGCHPSWNQTLCLKTQVGLLTWLEINIFDEVKINISDAYTEEDMSLQSKTVHYRFYNNWLGSVQIPLYAVLSMGKLQGTFKINSPTCLLGYDITTKSPQSQVSNVNKFLKRGLAYISLQITTNLYNFAALPYNQPIPANDDYIVKHLNNVISVYENDFPLRRLSLTFIDSNGEHRCVTEFLQPILPPDSNYFPKHPKHRIESAISKSSGMSKSSSTKSFEYKKTIDSATPRSVEDSLYSGYGERVVKKIDNLEKAVYECLRYVSLIPTYEITEQYIVTLSGLELLKILLGSPLDHTLLLSSYFLYLGIKSWIIIGTGIPRGMSSYVLVKYNLITNRICLTNQVMHEKPRGIFSSKTDGCKMYIFDATTGDKFDLRDVSCPLKGVHYVFDNENIWVNVQSSLECESVSFDFNRSSDWRPVFDKTIFLTKMSTTSEINQCHVAPIDVEQFRQMMEERIKAKIQKWRPRMKTIWNRYCSTLLRETLPFWEYWSFNPSEPKPGLGQRLKQLTITYKMHGFPLNFPYVNMKTTLNRIKTVGVHVNDDPSVEFGLGVETFSYPNGVISVWVFLACITRN